VTADLPSGASKTLAEIRADVGNITLIWLLFAAVIGVTFSLSRVLETGWKPVMGLHIAILAVLAGLVYYRRRISDTVRSAAIVILMFVIGIGGNVSFGLPAGVIFFISGSIMAAVLFGERIGLACIGLTIVLQTVVYISFKAGLLVQPEYAAFALAPTTWISNAGAAIVAAIGPLIAVSRFTYHLDLERRRAEAASNAKSDFLAVMSHELRTPMTAILGFADLLSTDNLSPQQSDRVSKISKSGKVLLDLLNDLLDFSKIEAQRLQLEHIPFSLREIAGEAYDLMLPLARQKKLDFRLEYSPRLADMLMGDPVRLRQVMLNLIGNAIKFTPRGRVTVHAAQRIGPDGNKKLLVQVADTGIGISPEQQARLFQPFVQADQGTTRRYGGTGLGLTISRRLIELMGGEITVSSVEGQGATFTFAVPFHEDSSPSFPVLDKVFALPGKTSRALRILVADDNQTMRALFQEMLVSWGHDVTVVADGAAALDAVKTDVYDAVLMDIQMPGMDGLSATRAIRQLPLPAAKVPVIALTADIVAHQKTLFLEAGIDRIIGKPVDWSILAAELERHASGKLSDEARLYTSAASASAKVILDEAVLTALYRVLGAEAFSPILAKFRADMVRGVETLNDAVAAGDLDEAKAVAHRLKGICAQFGVSEPLEHLRFIEVDAQHIEDVRAILADVLRSLDAADRALSIWLAIGQPTPQ
jgi:signal transduction histidine kinase/DNA-binding NarL/FixJ family response regulator